MIEVTKRLQTIRFNTQTRIIITAIFFIVALIVTATGVLVLKIDVQEAQRREEEIKGYFEQSCALQFIFGNNLIHTLIMFIPIIGPIWGSFVLFNTGTIIAVIGIADGAPPILYFLLLFLVPVFWLEFGVYSVAMAQSVILLLQMLRHRGKKESVRTSILVTICTLILLLAAVVEWVILDISRAKP